MRFGSSGRNFTVDLRIKLTELYHKKQLGHFYLVQSRDRHGDRLGQWIHHLFNSFYAKESQLPVRSHPDILWIEKPETQNKYKQEDFKEFFSFLTFRPEVLKYKLVWIDQAHLISENVANKMLKSLESPPIDICIFFNYSQGPGPIATLKSRGISLRVPLAKCGIGNNSPSPELEQLLLTHQDFFRFCQKLKEETLIEENLFLYLVNKLKNPTEINSLWHYQKRLQEDIIYHNSPSYRHFILHRILSKSIWPQVLTCNN